MSCLPVTIFHNGCLSGPYLWKYKRAWSETWCLDTWQWEEGKCTRTIILPCILLSYLPLTIFFIMVAYPGHILESTKGIEIKHTLMLMRGNTEDKNNNPVLHFTWINYLSLSFFIKNVVLFVISWCTSSVGLQVLPFIDNCHLGSILCFQRFSLLFQDLFFRLPSLCHLKFSFWSLTFNIPVTNTMRVCTYWLEKLHFQMFIHVPFLAFKK